MACNFLLCFGLFFSTNMFLKPNGVHNSNALFVITETNKPSKVLVSIYSSYAYVW